VAAITENAGTGVEQPGNPTKADSAFLGWFSAANGGTLYSWPHTLSASITMHAQWQENTPPPAQQYTITFDSHGGSEVTAIRANAGTGVERPGNPTKADNTFLGWFSAANGGTLYSWPHALNASITMHAQWQENTPPPAQQYTITFDSHGGSEVTAIRANAGTGIGQPVNPTKANSAFLGWFSAANGGTLYSWPHTLSANITMHAQWKENTPPPAQQYTITFDTHGGSEMTVITQDEGTTVEKPTNPTRNGYDFEGWHSAVTGGTEYAWPHALTTNVTMHAQWTATPYTITYNLNGGTNNAANPVSYTVENPTTTLAEPCRADYTMGGWYDNAGFTGNAVVTIPAGSRGNKTFYARWTAVNYTIAYTLNGGTNNAANPVSYTVENPAITLAEPSRADYTFGGWYDNAGFTGTAVTIIPAGSTGAKTFYAKWYPSASIQITLQPVPADPLLTGAIVPVNQPATFNAGNGYSVYTWYWDGAVISGATSYSYTLTANSKPAGIYELSVVVTNNAGERFSARCRVTITAQ
jgi:uncharacterized repeat protein (TIGR02543 family)